MADESVLAQGGVERIGLDEAFIKVKLDNGEKKQIMADLPTHKEGVALVFKVLLDPEFGALKSLDEIDAVGHRVVQGGGIRQCFPQHNARLRLPLRSTLRSLQEVPCSSLWFPRYESSLRITSCLRDAWC